MVATEGRQPSGRPGLHYARADDREVSLQRRLRVATVERRHRRQREAGDEREEQAACRPPGKCEIGGMKGARLLHAATLSPPRNVSIRRLTQRIGATT